MRILDLGRDCPVVTVLLPISKRAALVQELKDQHTGRYHDASGVSKCVWIDKARGLVLKRTDFSAGAQELFVQHNGLVRHTAIVPYIAWMFDDESERFYGVQRRITDNGRDLPLYDDSGDDRLDKLMQYMSGRGIYDINGFNAGTDKRGRVRSFDYVGGAEARCSYNIIGETIKIWQASEAVWMGK